MKVNIDPVTRLEGHLSVSLEVEGGKVASASCAGTMFRGFEFILRGRDPLDATQITQRICGVCPVSHGIASSLALEQALSVQPPTNGRLLRNLILGANFIQSDILHFYHLSALDFVDITAITQYKGRDSLLVSVRDWVNDQLQHKTINPAAPFLPRYEGDYITDPEINIGAIQHYLQALRMRSLAHEMVAVFGGKIPHVAALVTGGVTSIPTVEGIEAYRSRLRDLRTFIDEAYLPDLVAVAKAYPQYASLGRGPGNLLSYGGFPEDAGNQKNLLTAGVYEDGKVTPLDLTKIKQDSTYSWYKAGRGAHPAQEETSPAPDKKNAYSWVKAPRYDDTVMEVGPLARVVITHLSGTNPALSDLLTGTLTTLGLSLDAMFSVLGRHLARALECKLVAERCEAWLDDLQPNQAAIFQGYKLPQSASGVGLVEAPRGALGHWITISDRVISHYECVVPTTWNCSPRDEQGRPGAVEQSLVGVPVANKDNPIEAMRVVRSFDPCLACAVH
jgi:Ni,Fe-hydrogenase I large subunit